MTPKPPLTSASPDKAAYWSLTAEQVMAQLGTRAEGLTADEARQRVMAHKAPLVPGLSPTGWPMILLSQFRSPLVLVLIFAAIVSAAVGERQEAIIIGVIVLASCLLSFTQEYGASKAMQALKARITNKAQVMRGGQTVSVPFAEIVPGDIIQLSAGNLIPADGVILAARDCNVSEAALTGEGFPVTKAPGVSPVDAGLAARSNVLYTGTSLRSGTATLIAVKTGSDSEFATIATAILRQAPETGFAKGIRQFGGLMTQIMMVMVIVIFFANLLLHRPLIDSLLFSLALAVGLTPELLPAIISVTLARGARTMAAKGVLVKRLEAIENLGSMDLLCTDKTGTLTEGVVRLEACHDPEGKPSDTVRLYARLNAGLQTGLKNPLDEAICADTGPDMSGYAKLDEAPYDFVRKRLSVTVRGPDGDLLVCKGAVDNVLDVCTQVAGAKGAVALNAATRARLTDRFRAWSEQGYRVLAVATRTVTGDDHAEAGLTLAGFLLFLDPPKAGMADTLKSLAARGIHFKMITGDNRYVAAHLASLVGLKNTNILTGADLANLTKDALFGRAAKTDLFVEIDPNQKERVIEALRRSGHIVGYLGDGINDAPALHEADIGISVEGAVDVAREAADMILLKPDLNVLCQGVDDGRRTFANTMKYISITTSASFGNMISMAVASLFLPFLPLLAKHILLNNFLSDIPSLAIATDRLDPEQTQKPECWDIGFVRRFMIRFGLISTVFDMVTFGFLFWAGEAHAATFQTGWFFESLVTELGIVMIIRTRKAFWKSRPGGLLMGLTAGTGVLALALPYLPFAGWLGFVPLPLPVIGGLIVITVLYLLASEWAKAGFFAGEARRHAHPVRSRHIAKH